MWDIISWLLIIGVVAAVIVAGAFVVRGYLTTGSATGALFGPRPERRLDVVDSANVDGRRKLILVRRDDVEHLIMTGGPVDVVIETGIGQKKVRTAEVIEAPTAVYSRGSRPMGQAVGEN
jgi:hypothetical protein